MSGIESNIATFVAGQGWVPSPYAGKSTRGPQSLGGYRTVTFGDSMNDFNFTVILPTSATYNPLTGVMTIVESGGHFKWKGGYVNFWNRSYPSLYYMKRYQVASIVNSTTYTINMTPAEHLDLPNGALSGITFAVPYGFKCSKGWLTWLNVLLNQRFDIVYHGAQSGDTTVDGLVRLYTDCLNYAPQVVAYQALGINDLTLDLFTTRNDVQRIMTNNKRMLDAIISTGARVLLGTLTPVASGELRAQTRIMNAVIEVNDFLWRYARGNPNVCMVDGYSSIINSTDGTGLAKSGVLSSTDFIHFGNVGGYRVARDNKAAVQAAFPSFRSTLPRSVIQSATSSALTTPTAVVANGVMTVTSTGAYCQKGQEIFIKGATGGWASLNNARWVVAGATASNTFTINTPGLPDGSVTGTLTMWTSRNLMPDPLLQSFNGTISNSIVGTAATDAAAQLNVRNFAGTAMAGATASIVADSEGFGNAQRIRVATAASGDQPGISFKNSIGTVDSKMIAGRSYYFEMKVVLTSSAWASTPISEIGFKIDVGANSTESWRVWDLNQFESTIPVLGENQTLHLRTGKFTVPADTSTIDSVQANAYVRYQAAQSTGTLDIDFSQICFYDCTPDEPAFNDFAIAA